MQFHLSAYILVNPCTAGDRKHRIGIVKERTFDGDLARGEENRPEAFIGLARNSTNAMPIVTSNLFFVSLIKDGVREGQAVAAD